MSLDDDIRILTSVNLFYGFTQEQLRLLAFGAENTRLPAGKELYQEGVPVRIVGTGLTLADLVIFTKNSSIK